MDFGDRSDRTAPPPIPLPRPAASEVLPRRRTKRACLTCQRKKLKCNGLQPCATCLSRNSTCSYSSVSPDVSRVRARYRHETSNPASHRAADREPGHTDAFAPPTNERIPESFNRSPITPLSSTERPAEIARGRSGSSAGNVVTNVAPGPNTDLRGASPGFPADTPDATHEGYEFSTGGGSGLRGGRKQAEEPNVSADPVGTISRGRSGGSEGERLNEQSRLLNDGKGRLLYLGDSASLSFLDTIRRLVESTLGPSDFTRDPHRHKLVEGSITVVKKPTHVLPDREAAEFLIDSFFSNTVGILCIIDREACAREVAQIYENPLAVEQSRLSILNLLFAVGLQMTRSSTGHSFRESQILKRLDASPVDRAELFYLNATYLNDPIQGFEDGDITSIQALLLITVFMLTVAKRNAAWAYFGMAVRSAYALGLHRKETDLGFAPAEQRMRRNIWKSLYVMDCFISAMLGRPNSINARDAPQPSSASYSDDAETEDSLEADALAASTRASQLIGDILSYVYAERKISVKLANHLSSRFHCWKQSLPPVLRWQNISLPDEDPRTTLAQLRVNLSYFHGIMLLTRPFLLQKIINLVRPSKGDGDALGQSRAAGRDETSSASAEPFPPACVRSAVYSIDAVQSALLKRALPRRDPFVIYWLFSAALIVFSNGFANVCADVDTARAMQTALNLMQYLGEADPLARRYNQILVAFHAAISRKESTVAARDRQTTARPSSETIFNAFFGGFGGVVEAGKAAQPLNAAGSASLGRRRNPGSDHGPVSNAESASVTSAAIPAAADWQPYWQPPSMHGTSLAGTMMTRGGGSGVMGTGIGIGTGTGISPPDYCLDFDAFLNGVEVGHGGSGSAGPTQDMYGSDSWMPLYATMDVG